MTFKEYRERSYFSALDGLRAVCAFGVIAAHMTDGATFGWLNGAMGVPVFFIISGYIITTLALREERVNGSVSLRAFYVRRSMRIFPLYYLVLALFAGAIALGWFADLKKGFIAAVPAYLFYYQEVPAVLQYQPGEPQPGSPFIYSWSLGIEEKFYLVWPFLAFYLWARRPGLRLLGNCVLLVFFSLIQASWRIMEPNNEFSFWPMILSFYLPISMGCLLAQLLDREEAFNCLKRLGEPIGAAAATLFFLVVHFSQHMGSRGCPEYMQLYSLAATLFIGSILTGRGPLVRILGSAPMAWLGRLSYGIYLLHGIALTVGHRVIPFSEGEWRRSIPAFLINCLVSVVMAYILAITIERPCIALGRAWSKRLVENHKKKLEPALEIAPA